MRDTYNVTKRCTACRDRGILQRRPENMLLGGFVTPCLGYCVRCSTCVDRSGVCVYVWVSYMRFNTCVCICGHGCIGHISAGLNPGQRSVLLLALWLPHSMTQQACGALVVTLLQQFTV